MPRPVKCARALVSIFAAVAGKLNPQLAIFGKLTLWAMG